MEFGLYGLADADKKARAVRRIVSVAPAAVVHRFHIAPVAAVGHADVDFEAAAHTALVLEPGQFECIGVARIVAAAAASVAARTVLALVFGEHRYYTRLYQTKALYN